MNIWKHRMPRAVDYIGNKGNNYCDIGNVLWYQIAIGMNILDPKLARQELQDYNLYNISKQDYKNVSEAVNNYVPNCVKTNDYYKSLQ